MNRPSEPFNAEERDLAQRLVRLGGPREPAPALDALILATARAAVSEPAAAAAPADAKVTPLRPRKPTTPRWPLGMGLAASLVLAAGIGWRLQGDGEGSSAESAVASAPVAANEESTEAVILEAPMVRSPPPPPPPLADASTNVAARRAEVAQQALAKSEPAPPSEDDFVADAPMAERIMAPAAAPPPPPIAAQGDVGAADESKALDAVSVSGSRVAPERAVGAAEYTRTPLNERRELERRDQTADKTTSAGASASRPALVPAAPAIRARGAVGSTESDAEGRNASRIQGGFDDSPPVSADSTEFRQAWLQRIRNHLANGEQNAARNSLQEFRRRYPDIELPADLQTLASTLPAP